MFVRVKNLHNKNGFVRQYLEIVENQRVDGKVHQRVVANLGRLDRAREGQIDALIDSLAKLLEGSRIRHDVEEAAFAMVPNRLMGPESKLGVSLWVEKVHRPEFESLRPQHFYRSVGLQGPVAG